MATSGAFVYVLRSLKDRARYYTGLSSNGSARLAAHNGGFSSHTADVVPWELIVSVWFADAERAAMFERYLKSGSGRAFAQRHLR